MVRDMGIHRGVGSMKVSQWRLILLASCFLLPLSASADGLMTIYEQALHADPSYRIAEGTYQSAIEAEPLALAALLPSVNFEGELDHTVTQNYQPTGSTTTSAGVLTLSVTQSIFDEKNWRTLKSAKSSVQAARATYLAASQDLMLRVAKAYFAALEANQVWWYSKIQTQALSKQLAQSRERYQVGLDPVTSVQETQAQYDAAVADELAAYNAMSIALEDLRALTGTTYQDLHALNEKRLSLLGPNPSDQAVWVQQALQQNYDLQAAQQTAKAAHETVLASFGAHLPVVSASGSYTYTHYLDKATSTGARRTGVPSVDLTVDLPIYSGGALSANDRQAIANEVVSQATAERTRREVMNSARRSYFGVMAGVSQVRATRQAVVSSEMALQSMRSSYDVGVRDLTDVLDAQSVLYEAQKDYTKQVYAYLTALLELKKAAGTLSQKDIMVMSSWFDQPMDVAQFYKPAPMPEVPVLDALPVLPEPNPSALTTELMLPVPTKSLGA